MTARSEIGELDAMYEVADDYELVTLDELARKAGLIWTCRADDARPVAADWVDECGWNNRRDRETCENCGARRQEL